MLIREIRGSKDLIFQTTDLTDGHGWNHPEAAAPLTRIGSGFRPGIAESLSCVSCISWFNNPVAAVGTNAKGAVERTHTKARRHEEGWKLFETGPQTFPRLRVSAGFNFPIREGINWFRTTKRHEKAGAESRFVGPSPSVLISEIRGLKIRGF